MKRVLGGIILAFGIVLAIWVGYNVLIEMQPEARGKNPLSAILMAGAFIFVGFRWLQNKSA